MPEQPPNEFPLTGRIVGVIYLIFCSAVGGGLLLLVWHPHSVPLQHALALALVAGINLTMIVRVKDATLQPIRWGLLWLAVGFFSGLAPLYVLAYLFPVEITYLLLESLLALLVLLFLVLLLWTLWKSSPPATSDEKERRPIE